MLPHPPVAMHSSEGFAVKRTLGLLLILAATSPAWCAIAIDQTKSTDRSSSSSSITSPSFSTTAANELLLAFISSDAKSAGVTVTGVTGAGLTWALVKRANGQLGTAEVWRAFATAKLTSVTVKAALSQSVAASITVVTFTGTDTTGTSGSGAIGNTASVSAPSGAPTASLTTTRNGSWVFGVGDDWDNAKSRTLGPGQTLVHQYLASVDDTYWVQRETAATATSPTLVTINDTAPTTDRYNLTIVEVLPGVTGPTYAVSGTASPTTLVSGASVVLSQNGSTVATTTIDGSGNFSFPSVANGTYTVTPTQSAVDFSPATQNVTVNGGPATVPLPFAATQQTVSGTALPATLTSGASVVLSRTGTTLSTTVDPTGAYSFVGVANGTYTVTPSQSFVVFSPTSQTAIVNGANYTVPVFNASAQKWTVSGAVNPANSGVGTLLSLTGTASDGTSVSLTATASASGAYTISNVPNGSYTVTPTKNGYTFSLPSASVSIMNANGTANFLASPVATYTISGTVTPLPGGAGTLLTLSGSPSSTTTADSVTGAYSFPGLGNNTYTVTPSKTGYTFTPPSQMVTVNGADMPNINFTDQQQQGPPLNYPDLSDIIPTSGISVTGSGANRVFQYTHDTFNGGSGPLVIQPALNAASGNYQGTQYIYSLSAGKWTLSQQIPIAGVFIFDSDHGHFHFPFTSYGLYTDVSGSIGTAVATSPKVSFCINDSFIYDPSLPNAGALGNLGSCGNPTSLRGLDIGAVDEYDQTDAGQNISLSGVPDGTYWLRAVVDPNNFLFESDKSNNETDVQLTIAGNKVTILQTVTPVLPPPPTITLTAPTDQTTVSATVPLTASTATGTAVQFLLDGQAFGTPVPASPYTLNWDTTTAQNGAHWLAAQTTDPSSGRIGTSGVARVTVSNTGTQAPAVTLSTPPAGSTASATITIGANVAAANPISSVQFYVDNSPMGAPLSAPPYLAPWNTNGLSNGQHTLSASATDSLGLTSTSAGVPVTVDNSHPPNLIGMDATVSTDASGILTTPVFSTTTAADFLVAFVAYDGPSNAPQSATVSGAGLVWTLLKRSNLQHGTAEVWAAQATTLLINATVISQPALSGYHGSLTAIAFTNAAGSGVVGQTSAPSGAPDQPIPGVGAGNWVFAVGNDWDRAAARTPVSGQVLVHQQLDNAAGNTFWVQSTTAPSAANALVDIHDNAPTNDQWNLAAVEIVATHQ